MSRLDVFVFDSLGNKEKASSLEEILCGENPQEFAQYSRASLAKKNLSIARKLASYILNDQGDLDLGKVVECIQLLTKYLYPLGPHRQEEGPAREHLLKMLEFLHDDQEIKSRLRRFFVPSYAKVQDLIRNTLALSTGETLTVRHVREAVLVSLFTYLRQDVGSCFATALAILIHQEYPLLFVRDLEDLLSSGKISRIIGDQEISVPINLLPSVGDLFKPIRVIDLYPNPVATLASWSNIQAAFDASGIFPKTADISQEIQTLLANERVYQKIQDFHGEITAHDVIQDSLLHYYQISPSAVQSSILQEGFRNRKWGMTPGASVLSASSQHVLSYLESYEQATQGFIRDTQNVLLKSWEYTLATLADANQTTTVKHLQIALGWDAHDEYGLYAIIRKFLDDEIKVTHTFAGQCEQTYQEAKAQLEYVESRMRNPINKQDSQILAMDHVRFRQELNQALQDWNAAQEKLKKIITLPDFLLSFYSREIPVYFRSIYDAFIREFSGHYADGSAGFRIVFTYGRSHPNTWEPIYSIEEFIHALTEFFTSTEGDLLAKHNVSGLEKETSVLLHHIVSALHEPRFQEAAMERILNAYDCPIPQGIFQHLDQITHTPWVYVSGGTVTTLVSNYFENKHTLSKLEKLPADPHELAAFFADALKDLPEAVKEYLEDGEHSLLAATPSHVFSVTAGSPLFRDAWTNDWYSYTWLRDVWVSKHQAFLKHTIFDKSAIYAFITRFCARYYLQELTQEFVYFCDDLSLSIPELYDKSVRFFQSTVREEKVIATLQRYLAYQLVKEAPYISEQRLPEVIRDISSYLGISSRISYDRFASLLEENIEKHSLISSSELRHLYKGLLMAGYQRVYHEEDLSMRLIAAMRHHGLAYPAPLLFGDTNWAYRYFGFILHPGTQEIDLWDFNYLGLAGRPSENKDRWFGQNSWVLYPNPIDYGMVPPPGYRSGLPKGFF
ncbi:hypothetical protein C6H88_04540 [Chlamydia muridarum str. Nigg]|uniref:Uncharacterized protein n=1 Tax=Chlamydia muridarum TaxID=83560 RepID=A0A069ZXK6_CHLMR|nr:hypothetical protein [Chlamydia muridarum]UFT54371.1 hypothetical protein FTN45_04695 [Chlamydia trachomatis]AHH23267.1 hypothetical protein TAC_04660 [Chlamydia muridarum str. Nigg3 CMUT3-5]AHH24193.1 hypothetical protein Y015_04660 [Chlamydia muridarum str. Nigg CM972]AID38391.1 hypothetical protein BB17_04715 [Chlamydia muridarum str. Nigg 2 MCR]AIT91022.1 hypothetical protein NC80_04435 [Chlamydia muridarum]